MKKRDSLLSEAKAFILQYYQETEQSGFEDRWAEIKQQIQETGSYTHTLDELDYGGKLAWRNSNRCVGRLFWKTLKTLDKRSVSTASDFKEALIQHIQTAETRTKIRSTITIFAPSDSKQGSRFRIKNYTLLMYAGYEKDNQVIGDPKNIAFTKHCESLGWKGEGTHFDLLPVVYSMNNGPEQWLEIPRNQVSEVYIGHSKYPWFADLGLKWYKLPIISFMSLNIGGIVYPAAPFNGWDMLDEIATRNFGDENRYNMLPDIAKQLDLDLTSPFWKEKALTVLSEAVYYSFEKAYATIVDRQSAVEQFMKFMDQENQAGRQVTGDWSWLIPPNASSTTAIFHTEISNELKFPNFI